MSEILDWSKSATRQFGTEELKRLQEQTPEQLVRALAASEGEVIIRALAELLAHGEKEKLLQIGNAPEVAKKWQSVIVETFSPDMFALLAITSFLDQNKKATA